MDSMRQVVSVIATAAAVTFPTATICHAEPEQATATMSSMLKQYAYQQLLVIVMCNI
jgi:hypothetical protein